MSQFDTVAAGLAHVVASTFGDAATWVQDAQTIRLTVVVDAGPGDVGVTGRAIDTRIELTAAKLDLKRRPLNGEAVNVLGGLWAGTYTVDQVVEDDGLNWRVAVR